MMNRLTVTFVLLAGANALAAESIDRTIDAAADGDVYISNISGWVEVEGWSRNQVELTGELGSGVEELVFERNGNEVVIKVKIRRNSRNASSELRVKVPEQSSVDIDVVSADIDVSNVYGEQDLVAVSGDIKTTVFGSDIDAESVSGDVEIVGDNQDMRARLSTVSGDVDTENLAGEIVGDSVSGDIDVSGGSFSRAKLETVNGNIVYHAEMRDGGRLDVETINGSVDVELAGDLSARIDVETFNGRIRNCFGPDPVRTDKYAPGSELKFTEGGGSGRVTIQTLNGGIRLCK